MNIVKDLVSSSKYNIKCPYSMTPKFIVIHNTANDASAKNEITYMKNNNNEVSFHFAVDDVEARQGLPLDRNGWHAGDGGNGQGNRYGIAIEICYSKSGGDKFTKAEKNAAKLAAQLMHERGWDISHLKKHQDFSNKYCPHRTLDLGWDRFKKMVQTELNALEGAKDTIKKYRPKLAICLYHKPQDLWEIPLFIKSIDSNYKIFIRHHTDLLNETVCYAIPK